MNKVYKEQANTGRGYGNGNPVGSLVELGSSGSFGFGMLSVFASQNHGGATFGTVRVARGNNLHILQAGSSEITVMNFSRVEPTWGRSCPSGEVSLSGDYSECPTSYKLIDSLPAQCDGFEWVMNADRFVGVDNFGSDNEYPEQTATCQSIGSTDQGGGAKSSTEEGPACQNSDYSNKGHVNPVSSGAVDIVIGHVPNLTADESSLDLLVMKGN